VSAKIASRRSWDRTGQNHLVVDHGEGREKYISPNPPAPDSGGYGRKAEWRSHAANANGLR